MDQLSLCGGAAPNLAWPDSFLCLACARRKSAAAEEVVLQARVRELQRMLKAQRLAHADDDGEPSAGAKRARALERGSDAEGAAAMPPRIFAFPAPDAVKKLRTLLASAARAGAPFVPNLARSGAVEIVYFCMRLALQRQFHQWEAQAQGFACDRCHDCHSSRPCDRLRRRGAWLFVRLDGSAAPLTADELLSWPIHAVLRGGAGGVPETGAPCDLFVNCRPPGTETGWTPEMAAKLRVKLHACLIGC